MDGQPTFTGQCPMCQYSDKTVIKQVTALMNRYKNQKGEIATMNSNEDKIETPNGVVWTKQALSPSETAIPLRSGVKIEGVVSQSTQQAAVVSAMALPASLEIAGDPTTGLAKGATIKLPSVK